MKILVVCQYYYPEPVRITDICEELVTRGNEVTVLTQIPNYPMGEFYNGYDVKKNRQEVINGVNVHRCFTIPRKTGFINRILNYYSFSISSTLYINKLKKDFDVIFVNQLSPVMMARAAIKYKKKYHKKLILYCLDLWPDSLVSGGVKKGSIIYNIYKNVSKRIYKKADKILITSKSFKQYFNDMFEINDTYIDYLPQYAESLFDNKKCSKVPDDKINLIFAGNIGKAQSMSTILEAVEKTQDIKELYWHIIGDGSEYDYCRKAIIDRKLENIVMHGRKPIEEMPRYYKMADAMIVTLSGESEISMTLPGKVQTYMAAGKPIIGAANGETKEIIEQAKCGFCGEADNSDELAKNVRRFIKTKDKKKLEKNSLNFYEKNFTKKIFINKLMKELKN